MCRVLHGGLSVRGAVEMSVSEGGHKGGARQDIGGWAGGRRGKSSSLGGGSRRGAGECGGRAGIWLSECEKVKMLGSLSSGGERAE